MDTRTAYITDVEGQWERLESFARGNDWVRLDGTSLVVAPGVRFVFGGDAMDRGPAGRDGPQDPEPRRRAISMACWATISRSWAFSDSSLFTISSRSACLCPVERTLASRGPGFSEGRAGVNFGLISPDGAGAARSDASSGTGFAAGSRFLSSGRTVARMQAGEVPVVAGFQGVEPASNRITTLGRGGSDLSAVALAAAVRADRCDIYTDVDGIYTTDPRIVPRARKLDHISYEEMLELASVGAKVLQTRSVELAMKQRVRVQVLSSFEDKPGSLVVDEDEIVEQPIVSGIAYSRDDAKVTLRRVPDRPGIAAGVFGALAQANVNVDMIVQNLGADGTTDMTFTVGKADLARTEAELGKAKATLGFESILADPDVAKISVVGVGMRSHAGVANTMFRTLAEKGINIQVISTSEIKVSVLIGAEYTELAVRALHSAYGLDGPAS